MRRRLATYDIVAVRLLGRPIGKVLLIPVPKGRTWLSHGKSLKQAMNVRDLLVSWKNVGFAEIAIWRIEDKPKASTL